MHRVRYTEWDGSQKVRLTAERVFEKLAEYLSYTDDVQQAWDWLLRHGLDMDGVRVMGLDDFLEQLREAIRERQRQFNLDRALDPIAEKLEELLDLERATLEAQDDDAAAAKRAQLEQLPRRLSDAIEQLRNYEFEDEDARSEFEALLEELDTMRALEDFRRRYGELFQGPQALDYEQAVDLMREIERLKQLEDDLLAGRLETLSLDDLREALGDEAAQDFQSLRQFLLILQQAGYVGTRGGRVQLSPKGMRKIGQLALRDIYQGLLRDRAGGHQADHRGLSDVRPEETRAYQFGDPLHVDVVRTLRHALARDPRTPLRLQAGDFEVYETTHTTTASTVLLLDMSWSMSWEGRFAAAKKVALAMESLIRSRFPRDYFAVVGFYTRATELKLRDLPEASWNMGDPFTNLQDGLRLASDLLAKHPSPNQQMIVVTDGQPTAYYARGRLYCEWPLSFGGISMRAAQETLKEVERVTRNGVVINTFMLDDSPSLRAFVERMTRINRGRALFTRPDRLGEYLLVDYIARKRKRV
ncbi:MAG TPA: VWA domain-containing protein [Candidatus Dormibacteraeota bacterium]|nr:VWA domain-containing protein [Candidatus Dormibacteraeota bacterium]